MAHRGSFRVDRRRDPTGGCPDLVGRRGGFNHGSAHRGETDCPRFALPGLPYKAACRFPTLPAGPRRYELWGVKPYRARADTHN